MVITFFPIFTNASQRSPSSNGTRTTSAEPIPSEQHLALSELNPGILSSAFAPRASIPTFFIILVSPATLSGVLWNKLTSTFAPLISESLATSLAANATTFPFTEITGFLASIKAEAAALMALNAGKQVCSPSK